MCYPPAVGTAERASRAPPRTERVRPASPAGTARGATGSVRPVTTAAVARRRAPAAGTPSRVTRGPGNVPDATLDGEAPGAACVWDPCGGLEGHVRQ